MKPVSYKRILAYLIDILIVTCIATILTMFIPVSEEYTNQMNELNHSPIFHYILMYDNDEAGRKGANRFKKLIRDDVLVDDIIMPYGKDVADLSKEEFLKLLKSLDK